MVPRLKSAGSRWRDTSEDLRGCTQSHVNQRAPVACGRAWAAGKGAGTGAQTCPQRPGSPLVPEVPQVTDPYPHVRATPAGVPVCSDPTHPRSHHTLQVFGSSHAVLCPHISKLSTVASCYCINTRPDSRQSRVDPKGKRGSEAATKAIMCYHHGGRRCRV